MTRSSVHFSNQLAITIPRCPCNDQAVDISGLGTVTHSSASPPCEIDLPKKYRENGHLKAPCLHLIKLPSACIAWGKSHIVEGKACGLNDTN